MDWKKLMEEFWTPFKNLVDKKKESVSRSDLMQARTLGKDPKSGKEVSVRYGRYGPFAQIGTRDDEEKPLFASLDDDQKIDTISLQEALKLFSLPRELGQTAGGETIQACKGRWGAYLKYGAKNVSIKNDDPYSITLQRALEIIDEKKKIDEQKIIQDFGTNNIQVLNGHWGPYVSNGKKNVKIAKDQDPKSLTLAMCKKMLAKAPIRKGRSASSKRKNT